MTLMPGGAVQRYVCNKQALTRRKRGGGGGDPPPYITIGGQYGSVPAHIEDLEGSRVVLGVRSTMIIGFTN
jgi:hypothetical protein